VLQIITRLTSAYTAVFDSERRQGKHHVQAHHQLDVTRRIPILLFTLFATVHSAERALTFKASKSSAGIVCVPTVGRAHCTWPDMLRTARHRFTCRTTSSGPSRIATKRCSIAVSSHSEAV